MYGQSLDVQNYHDIIRETAFEELVGQLLGTWLHLGKDIVFYDKGLIGGGQVGTIFVCNGKGGIGSTFDHLEGWCFY